MTSLTKAAAAKKHASQSHDRADDLCLEDRMIDGKAQRLQVNLAESPLGWLMRRALISGRQFDAGEQLRRDYEMAQMGPRITMRWDDAPRAPRRGPTADWTPGMAQIAARQRFDAATAAVGSGLSDILWRVVCLGDGMEAAERAMRWPARSGKVILALALDRLADHYRLP